jgi:fructose-1-phosphate kinase PfkB-like protein
MQLNRREAAAHLRTNTSDLTDAQVVVLLDSWSRHGVRSGIVTNGPSPAFAKLHGRHYRVRPPAIAAVNAIGSGDCLLAGITDAWLRQLDAEATLRHGLACAVANALVWDAGAIDPATVERYAPAVVIEANL